MSDEDTPKAGEPTASAPGSEQADPGPKQADTRFDPGAEPTDPTSAFLESALSKASHGWLRDRFRLDEDAEGQLHIPEPQRWPDLGTRAEQFVSGLMKGLVQKTPEEKEAAMGLRDPEDVPRGTEVIGRLLSRFSNTVTDTWKEFVAEHASRETAEGKKVVDGEFVVRHGATLLGTFVSRLGEAFEGVGTPDGPELGPDFGQTKRSADDKTADTGEDDVAAASEAPAAASAEPAAEQTADDERQAEPAADPGVKVEVDLGSIFRALFSPRG